MEETKRRIINLIREYQKGEHWEYHEAGAIGSTGERCVDGNCPEANRAVDVLETIAPEEFYEP